MNPNTALQTLDPKSNIVLIKQIRILRFTESTIESNPTQDLILYSIFKLFTPLQHTQQSYVFPDRLKKSLGGKIGKIKDHNYNDLSYMYQQDLLFILQHLYQGLFL